MNIAFLTPSLSRTAGGIFEIERGLAQALLTCPQTRVQAYGVADKFTKRDAPLWGAVPLHAYRAAGPRSFGYSPALRHAFFSCHADIAHLHALWTYASSIVNTWHHLHRRPYVTTLNGMLEPWAVANSARKKKIAAWLYEGRCLAEAACVQVNSEAELKAARAFGLKNAIAVIPNGVEAPSLHDSAEPPADDPVAAAQARGMKILLYLGRLHPKKGLANLIQALAQVGGQSSEWVLAIAGWNQVGHEAELRRLAATLRLGQRVLFLGAQFGAQKGLRYRQADAFILPSYSEGLPMAVLEAWSYGKAVLMTPACNLPVGFSAGAAMSIEPEPAAIADGLRRLAHMTDAERTAMGGKGRRLTETQFSWRSVAEQMRAVYDWALTGRLQPDCVVPAERRAGYGP
jgi:poly(glycerol-phosphate) alpha-glucosyltransferase